MLVLNMTYEFQRNKIQIIVVTIKVLVHRLVLTAPKNFSLSNNKVSINLIHKHFSTYVHQTLLTTDFGARFHTLDFLPPGSGGP